MTNNNVLKKMEDELNVKIMNYVNPFYINVGLNGLDVTYVQNAICCLELGKMRQPVFIKQGKES